MSDPRFVLVHSPLVGPATWSWVAAALVGRGYQAVVPSFLGVFDGGAPYLPRCVDAVAAYTAELRGSIVLVGHSGAGPRLPQLATALPEPPSALVFVDGGLPADPSSVREEPSWFVDLVGRLARDGWLPKWSQWWGQDVMENAVPDPARRAAMEAELPRVPLDYFSENVPVPEGWDDDVLLAYLQFSPVFDADATAARERGWVVDRLAGSHLHMLVDPDAVANWLVGLSFPARG